MSKFGRKIGNVVSFTDAWRVRQLLFLGLIVPLNGKFLPVMLTATEDGGKRCRGRPFRIIRDALIENLLTIIPNVDSRGRG